MKSSLISKNNFQNKYGENELIQKRRKRKKIKRYILLSILLISISIILCLKLPYFNINTIEVENNRNITSDEIIKLSNIEIGKNIFYINLKRSKTNIMKNSYILDVNIRRQLPNKIKIYVEERTAVFYIKKGEKYLVVDDSGVILEEKQTINGMKLIRLDGFDKDDYKVGEVIKAQDTRKIKIITEITELIKNLKEGIPEPSIVDLTDLTDIRICYGDMIIKLGTSDNMEKKYNMAINILMYNKLINKKGYIDVSYKGDPVFFVES
ncbi:cell division protein FtsQ/DivIB [Clostridium thermopalmarium]|uniref:Cell division protein DivIB n=1 Tax=Clostridium thermopalmarium DSM 5974 TaxID=1121340 RepID=A0A2T0AWR2_9CLOT|nr:FtsQ-type POTRA domain-containing protein [Clostridium thermopalmarium]PRR75160.1 Cell division protein DivIB [Clostridium thermopalmarium DSM 5974]PVZ27916.1 cell division protein FtsQ [Clostridium thermopalmarium DSM 5974]